MFYLDSQRTTTRRDSSLITNIKSVHLRSDGDSDTYSTVRGQSFDNESTGSGAFRTVETEVTTLMFEAMLSTIVASWETIPMKKEESLQTLVVEDKNQSDETVRSKKKKHPSVRSSRTKRSRSKIDDNIQSLQSNQMPNRWPDERAIIKFKNGNSYEGQISMKCMNGEGRFQWADGTVYLGSFKDNEIRGQGEIHWKDDTWYQGEFLGNLRHGRGLFVDSRKQRSYSGDWHYGSKHGEGVIYYSKGFKNSYHGQWVRNERFGYGSREYSEGSGYKGQWERNIRDGKGLMIWPNHDFYRGDWRYGAMSGFGIYIWESCFNNTLSLPNMKSFRGVWVKGERNGFGILDLGLDLGAYYKGEFKSNQKHGPGRIVTTNGVIIQHKNLFFEGNMGPFTIFIEGIPEQLDNPMEFDMYDPNVGLIAHVEQAIQNLDMEAENRSSIVEQYSKNNKIKLYLPEQYIRNNKIEFNLNQDKGEPQTDEEAINLSESAEGDTNPKLLKNILSFEVKSLSNALSCYATELFNIYTKYATICNSEEIEFQPVLIRLFLWQLYYDCNIHAKGLTLFEIDNIFYENSNWLAKTPHNPFEKLQYWQFIHSLISVASRLYCRREIPQRPDTMIASAFRTFMEKDLLPSSTRQRGCLVKDYGRFIPLKATYKLYRDIGEPHTIRDFLCAVRRPSHCSYLPQPAIIEAPESCLPLGHNAYIFGDELAFIVDDDDLPNEIEMQEIIENLKLFNFGNLSTMSIIKIFSKIFPGLCNGNIILNLDVKLTFFEFFQAFVECAKKSISYDRKELVNWKKKLVSEKSFHVPSKVRHHHSQRNIK